MRASRATASAAASTAAAACAVFVTVVVRAQPLADVARRPVTWRAPAGCPSEDAVNVEVASLLAGSNAAPVNANAEVEHAGASWRVVVTMNGGVRRLEASSCRALAEATELIVAMAVDPARVAQNRTAQAATVDAGAAPVVVVADAAPSSFDASLVDAAIVAVVDASPPPVVPMAPPPVTPAPVAPPPVANAEPPDASAPVDATAPSPRASSPSPSSRSHTTFAATALGAIDLGTLPAPGVGPSIGFAWTPLHFRFELAGAYFFPDSTRPAPISLAVERFTMLTVAARACYLARADSFEAGPCLEAEVVSVHGEGIVALPSSGSSGWVAPGAGLFGAWRFAQSLAVVGRLDALIPTIRPDFQVDGATLHRPAFLTGRLSLGAELRF